MKSFAARLPGQFSSICARLPIVPVVLACCLQLAARAQQLPDPITRAGQLQTDPSQDELPPLHLRNRETLVDPEPGVTMRPIRIKRFGVKPRRVHTDVSPACKSPKLSYFGGPVISNVQAVSVFWNSDVNASIQSNMGQFFADLGVSPLMSVLSQYSTNGNNVTSGTDQWIGNGTSGGSYTLTPSKCRASGNATKCTLQDTDIQNEINAQITAGHLPEPTYDFAGNPNTVYMTFFPPKVVVDGPFGSGASCVQFCAYHNTGTMTGSSTPLLYGVLMDEFTSACNAGCGADSTALENQTDTASHEFAEAVTDADVGLDTQNGYADPAAWGDNNNGCGEIADICDTGSAGDTFTVSGRTWTVQEIWSNLQGQCVSTGNEFVPFTLSSPGAQTAGTSFHMTLTAQNPVGGPDAGYPGTVHFTSSDPSAVLPADYTYSAGDSGAHNFSATLITGTSQTITATDTRNPNLTVTDTYSLTQPPVQVSVGTNPAGLSFTVDSTTYSSPHSFTWTYGTSHSLSTTTQQPASTGAIEVFQNWSDGGALSHSVTAIPSTTSYVANFALYYALTPAANPAAGGSVTPSALFYPSSSVIDLSATANPGYSFLNWTGPVASATSASTTVTMSGPETVTANFIPNLVVTTPNDDAGNAANCTPQTSPPAGTDPVCSLRDALAAAASAGGAGIYFSPTQFSGPTTITLSNGTLIVPPNTTITGPTVGSGTTLANLLTVSGGNASTVFTVNSNATATISGLAVTGGTVAGTGGGISNAGTLTLTNCTISGNKAASTIGGVATGGGGIYNSGVMSVTGCTISGNSAKAVGAAAIGGGIDNQGVLFLTNSTVAGNSVSAGGNGSGGGIYTAGSGPGVLQMTGGTVTGNVSDGQGGGVSSSFLAVVANSIVSGNSQTAGTDYFNNGGTLVNNGGNLIGVTGLGLAPLGNYGGPTQTMLPLPGSAAICAGTTANANGITTDQRAFSRTANYGAGSCVDAGAVQTGYLLQFTTQPPASAIAGHALTPAPIVSLSENSNVASAATSAVTMTDSSLELSGIVSGHLVAGSLKFSGLVFNGAATDDTLTATIALTPSLNLTASALTEISVQQPATLSSPSPGSVLTGPDATFGWSAVAGAQAYQLWLGTTGVASSNLCATGPITATSVARTNMPLNGATIYARLYTEFSGTWYHIDYTYTSAAPAALTAPGTSGTLPGPVTTFTWSAAAGAGGYQLWLGTTGVNSSNLFSSGLTHVNTTTRTNMPTNGGTIYARLFTNFSGTWVSVYYTFTAAMQSAPVSPAVSGTLPGPATAFTWTTATGSDAAAYQFWLGTTGVASSNLYSSGILHTTSVTRTNMPTNGETLYARLYTDYNGTWVHQDYTLTAASASVLTSPAPGGTLPGANVTFNWSTATGSSLTAYQLWLGTTGAGSNNLYSSGATTATSVTRTNMPTNGATIYARLYTNYNGTWVHTDYTYQAAP